MNHGELEAAISSKTKLRIYGQLIGYEKLSKPIMTQVKNPVTGEMMVHIEEYKEHEGKQFAVNHNSLYIRENELDMLLSELCKAIKDDARKKGLIV